MLDVSEQDTQWRVAYIKASLDQAAQKDAVAFPVPYMEQWRRRFKTFKDLPMRTQETVACLSMCADTERIPGLGQKLSRRTYWLDDNKELLEEYERTSVKIPQMKPLMEALIELNTPRAKR